VKRRWAALFATGFLAAAGVALVVVGVRLVGLETTRAKAEAEGRGRRVLDALRREIGETAPLALGARLREASFSSEGGPAPWSPSTAPEHVRVALAEADWTEVRRSDPAGAAVAFGRVADAVADPMTKSFASLRAGVLLARLGDTEEAVARFRAARSLVTDSMPFDDGAVSWAYGPGLVAARHLAAIDLRAGRGDSEALTTLASEHETGYVSVSLARPGRLGFEDLLAALAREVEGMPAAPAAAVGRLGRVRAAYRTGLEDVRRLGNREALAADGVVLVRSEDRVTAIPVENVLKGRAQLAAAGAPGEFGATTDPATIPPDAISTRAGAPLDGLHLWIRPVAERGATADAGRAVGAALGVYLAGAALALLALRRSARAARMQADFVASVSHEMKTPIASVQAMAEMLADGRVADPAKAHDYAARIQAEMTRLGATVRDVLDVSRIERDAGAVVNPRPMDPAAAVTEAVEAARPGLERRGFRVDLTATPAPTPLPLDPDAFAHVVHNLLDNAAKFAGADRRIEVEAAPVEGGYVVQVLDRGPGVPASERERVFERFSRGEEARVRAVPGVGLGLYVAREIVRAHGGTIRVESREGGGARFVVEIPEGVR
jgi:signal transduction histidine kinase